VAVKTAEKEQEESARQPKAEGEGAGSGHSSRDTIAKLLDKIETKLQGEDLKVSLGDFIRLVQLEKELADEETPREIKVTWVEPRTTSDSAG